MSLFESIGNFLGVGNLGEFASLAGQVAPVVGAGIASLSKPEMQQQATGGFESMPREVQDFYLNTYFPAVKEAMNLPYPTRPTRVAPMPGDAGFDPIFSSYGLADMQDYLNQQAAVAPATAQQSQPVSAPMTPAQQEYMAGMMEAQRIAATPVGSKVPGTTKAQIDALRRGGLQPFQAQQLLSPESAGYENPYTGETVDRNAIISKLGQLALMGDPLNQAATPKGQMSDADMRAAIDARNAAMNEFYGMVSPLTYSPPKYSIGDFIGGTVLPIAGTAAFAAGAPVPNVGRAITGLRELAG